MYLATYSMPNSAPLSLEQINADTTKVCREHDEVKGALLPILNSLQDRLGYLPKEAVPIIAKHLNLSRAEVHGVISFYHLYRDKPGGKHTLYVCCAEACQAMGARELMTHATEHLGTEPHGTTKDGLINLEPIYCLGNCACAPAVMLDEELHARVDLEKFNSIVERARKS